MANQKITDLTEKATLANDDLFEIVDSVTGTNKKVKSRTILPEANTWYVNPAAQGGNGSPQKPYTVNEAMAAASEGDIIFFQAGTYTADITVTKDLIFVGYSVDACIIDIENLVIDTDSGVVTTVFKNLSITSANGIIEGANQALLTFRNIIGFFDADITVERLSIDGSNIGVTGGVNTSSFAICINSRIECTTWTIDGTSKFRQSTIIATISAATRTLTFNTCDITGDVNCANLTYTNTVITGTKVGTSSTTVNNQ